tara:strand:+ start:313 stop:630 length:318 start_codon:yes stop_codon:yes gene_type:complete
MSFDPTNYSVKNAAKELDGLSLEDLRESLKLEIDNKHRSSLIAEIGKKIDAVKTEASEEPVVEAASPVEPPAVEEVLTMKKFARLRSHERKAWRCEGPDRFVKIG